VKRFVILGALGVAAILLAAGLDLFINRDEAEEPVVTGTTPALPEISAGKPGNDAAAGTKTAAVPGAVVGHRDGAVEPAAAAPAITAPAITEPAVPPPPAGAEKPASATPTFDIVRVNREGAAVIAGHAAPDATVTVRDGTGKLGTVQADRRGDWVLIPDRTLEPGTRQLSLESEEKGGRTAQSEQVVVLAIPERDAAAGGTLAVAIPRDEVAPSRLLQRPEAAAPVSTATAREGANPARGSGTEATVSAGTGVTPAAGATAPALPSETSVASADTTVDTTAAGAAVAVDGVSAADASATDRASVTASASPAVPPDRPVPDAGTVGARRDIIGSPPSATVVAALGAAPRDPVPATSAGAKAGDGSPRVETIDYDEKGSVALSGAARPGSSVNVFLDGASIGTVKTDGSGRWQLTPQADVPSGRYTLRAEERDAAGNVQGRVELPFERAGPISDLAPGQIAVVQPGNSLWRIARRTYGEGVRYTVIYEANRQQIRNPDIIFPGQIFTLPKPAAAPGATTN